MKNKGPGAKRIIALFLSVVLVLTMFPVSLSTAFSAVENTGTAHGMAAAVSGAEANVAGDMSVLSTTPTVTAITVERQPKLNYTVGEALDLLSSDDYGNLICENLLVTLHYSDGSTIGPIEYSDYAYMGITTEPAHGTILTAEDDGRKVKVSCNGHYDETAPLKVTGVPADGAYLSPARADFDKNPAYQADVYTELQWWHNILSVTEVKNGLTSVGTDNYSVSQDNENNDFLIIKKEYLAAQPVGELVLTVEFSAGASASLTINIQDTTDMTPPSWPEGSALTATKITSNSVNLSWTPAQDDLGVAEYKIYQDDILVGTFTGTVNETEIANLSPATPYRFQVLARDARNQWTTNGPSLTVTTLEPPISHPPGWPAGSTLTASNITSNSVSLSWTPAQDDLGVTGYKIYQDGVLIDTLDATALACQVTGLAPATPYNFQVQAGDADQQWTNDGPQASVTTDSLAVPEIVELKLNAPRQNIKGSFYMGDTVEIELISTETGLQPEVTVNCREWNSERSLIEEKTRSVTLAETSPGSKKYTAPFILTEGIWEIVSLEAQLPGSSPLTAEINSRVAGRLKVSVQLPVGMDPAQLASSLVTISSAKGGGSFTGHFTDGNITVEGLDSAQDYMLRHLDAGYQLLYQSQAIDIKGGLEKVLNYEIGSPAQVKVRVIDDDTGLPLKNIMVTGKATRMGGTMVKRYAKTDANGYAAAEAPYFIKNALKGSQIELSTTCKAYENDGSDWYQDGSFNAEITATGDNEYEIRIKKAPMVTVTGTVRNSSGAPVVGAYVYLRKTVYKDGIHVVSISLNTETDEQGHYTLELAKIPGEIEVACYKSDMEKQATLVLEEGINTLDITIPPYVMPTVKVSLDTKDLSGNIGKIIIHAVEESLSLVRRTKIKVMNQTTGAINYSSGGNGYFYIPGKPGDIVEVSADGINHGLGKGSATAVINEDNYAEVTVLLTERGSIRAQVIESNGGQRIGENRYMYLYEAATGRYAGRTESSAPHISCSMPEGLYNVVLSWDRNGSFDYVSWLYNQNCIRKENLQVKDGEIIDLGINELHYNKSELCFRYNAASSITSNTAAALPGSLVTLRVVYDYDRQAIITPGKLDLAAQIPQGTTYVDNSVMHRMNRGSITASPVVDQSAGTITLDLQECMQGAAGTLTYQVRINKPAVCETIQAGAELRFVVWGNLRSEMFASCEIPTEMITLNSPLDLDKDLMTQPVKFSGLAPANHTVELYDGSIKIGEAQATPTGQWTANLVLPSLGAPLFHHLTAKTEVDGVEYSARDLILVGVEGVKMTEFALGQGASSIQIDVSDGHIIFPFAMDGHGDFLTSVAFSDNDKVRNVTIAGYPAARQGDKFQALLPFSIYTSEEILVDYEEVLIEAEDVSEYFRDTIPASVTNAEAAFTVSGTTSADVQIDYDADGYIKTLDIPEFRLTMPEGSITASMTVEPVTFDPCEAKNCTNLGNGLYGYDFSYQLIDGKYRITAYLDRRLLPQPADFQAQQQFMLMAVGAGLETVKAVLDIASDTNDLMGAVGDLSTTGKMIELLQKYEDVRPNLQPHLVEYYDRQIAMMGEDILMGKSLGYIGSTVAEAGNLVPLLGQVVVGAAELISGKLLGDMFDHEFESDYNRLMTEFKCLPGGEEEYYESAEEPYGENHVQPLDSYWYWYWYVYQRDKWYGADNDKHKRPRRRPVRPHWLLDPSGYVYEAVEDNRLEGVTTTALFLPKEAAQDAGEAKASHHWQFWDASWYLQENPQTTNAMGRYAWDVPEGWWMVQYVKDGYQTTFSDALPVPPPQLDVNIPMVQLAPPAVAKTVWGSGGRYVDIYFSKYMDLRSLEEANAIRLTDTNGSVVTGSIAYPVPVKTGVNNLNLTKVARFIAAVPLSAGAAYNLTVNHAVADYAGFSMTADYTGRGTVPPGAAVQSLTGSDITVEPGLDITHSIMEGLIFTPVHPEDVGILDKTVQLLSSHPDVVKIGDDGKAFSISEGTAQITATSMDDTSKTTVFTVTAAYPPAPVRVARMVILDQNGKALTDLSMKKGDTYTLRPDILPTNASNQKMVYSSDNPSVAAVDQTGTIQGLAEGIATIMARTEEQNIRQRILVKVLPAGTGGAAGNAANRGKGDVNPPQEVAVPAFELSFSDVQKNDWFYEAVLFLAEKGIAKGISETDFAPHKVVTRAEFITMLCRAFGIDERSGDNYADAGDNWYTGFLAAAKQLGLAQGVGENRFEPDRSITREEMIMILYNYLRSSNQIIETKGTLTYADHSQVSNWAREAVTNVSAYGWVKGKGNNLFDPQGMAVRAELAQLLYNILKE